jgi:hypothetical protein
MSYYSVKCFQNRNKMFFSLLIECLEYILYTYQQHTGFYISSHIKHSIRNSEVLKLVQIHGSVFSNVYKHAIKII